MSSIIINAAPGPAATLKEDPSDEKPNRLDITKLGKWKLPTSSGLRVLTR